MKKLGVLMLVSIVVGIILLLNVSNTLFVNQPAWMKLGDEDYRILFKKNGNALVYTALQESDKRKVAETIGNNPGIENNWNHSRPDIIEPPAFKILTKKNVLQDIHVMDTFSFQYQEFDGTNEVNFNVFNFYGDQVLSLNDPEYSNLSYGFIHSPDHKKGLIPTWSELWLIDSNKKIKKISSDTYNGKKYNDIQVDYENKLADSKSEGNSTVLWNNNPIFNTSATTIAYTTNRDSIETGGNSVWTNDIVNGEERKLLSGNGDFYNVLGWVNNEQILAEKWSNRNRSYLISDTTGNYHNIALEGTNPEILGIYGEKIVYVSDYSNPNHLLVGKIDQKNKSINTIYEKTIDGSVREWVDYIPFSEDGSKFAVLYLSDEQGNHSIFVADINSENEIIIDSFPIEKARIQDFYWIDNNRLLIHLLQYEHVPSTVSSWIYNLEGREK